MHIIYHSVFKEHQTGSHPENSHRLEALGDLLETEIKSGEEYLTLVHTSSYIDKVKQACARGIPLNPDTVTSPGSYNAAARAVQAAVMASRQNDMAIVRPPGHHSYPQYGSGFCLFNNIAIAVAQLVKEGKRALIFDFDGHCGDGTEFTFYNSDQVLFFSIHQYPAFPGKGSEQEIGEDKGKGFTFNMTLPPGSGDDLLQLAVNRFLPIAKQFQPDVVAVSAGFDAHQHDPLLELNWTVNSYYWLGEKLKENFDNVFAILEGGYNLKWLPKCVFNFLDGINGNTQQHSETYTVSSPVAKEYFEQRVETLESALSPYWQL